VASSVVDQLLKEPDKLKLGGEKRVITVFFSDLASFTSLGEKLKPEDLVSLVNQYLGAMTESIFKSEGTIDKYAGDGIMAFWGAPIDQSDHALRACKAALDNWTALRGLWGEWETRGLPKLEARIGINTGPMVVGNIGSTVKTDYTVMGDAVNLGSRLEGANKAYGTRIMINESTRVAAGDAIVVRELDLLAVKGKVQGVRVYELLGLAGDVPEDRVRGSLAYEEGLAAYRGRRWDDAERAFRRAIEILGEDKASRVFLERVARFRLSPPPADWDGTFSLLEK
jgi:adenylate cyclase